VSAISTSVTSHPGRHAPRGPARAARQRTSPSAGEAVEQHRGIGRRDRAHFPTHRAWRCASVRPWKGSGVEHEAEPGAQVRLPERRHVAVYEAHLDPNQYTIESHLPLPDPLARERKVGDLLTILARQRAETGG